MKIRGFTLLELLVVVAIIAILAAIIAPVFIQAKESARVRTCGGNLHMLGSAIMRYTDDNDGRGLPLAPFEAGIPDDFRNPWVLYVKPLCPLYTGQAIKPLLKRTYVANAQTPYVLMPNQRPNVTWVCPSDFDLPSGYRDKVKMEHPCWWYFGSSYMYPGPMAYLHADDATATMDRTRKYTPCKLTAWKGQKRDVLLSDYYCDFHSPNKGERYGADPRALIPPLELKAELVNVLFLDLHIQSCTADERTEYLKYTVGVDNPYYDPLNPEKFELVPYNY